MNILQKQESFYDEVEWYDTDASEDEDYLPPLSNEHRKKELLPSIKNYFLNKQQQLTFTQISGSSFDSQTSLEEEAEEEEEDYFYFQDNAVKQQQQQQQQRRLSIISTDTPLDKVRRAMDKTIDYGIERVDISHVELTEIPDDIEELQYVTVVHNDIVKIASLQIFLYGNDLHSINPCLFRLKNLTVLSLRNNRLTSLSPDIALLENLVELSLGNNQLKYIPAELTRLKKLSILSLFPNPFLQTQQDNLHCQHLHTRRTSLVEVTTRAILAASSNNKDIIPKADILPADIVDRFKATSRANCCEHCQVLFHVPDVEELVWRNVLGNHHVPVLYRFCSVACCEAFPIKDSQATTAAAEEAEEEEAYDAIVPQLVVTEGEQQSVEQ